MQHLYSVMGSYWDTEALRYSKVKMWTFMGGTVRDPLLSLISPRIFHQPGGLLIQVNNISTVIYIFFKFQF